LNLERLAASLAGWISDRVREAGAVGTVVGVSGGVDSAVVLALCKAALKERVLGLILPCRSRPEDLDDAALVLRHFGVRGETIVLDHAYEEMLRAVTAGGSTDSRDLATANIVPRLRMTVLYFYANKLNYLVAGTGNRSEIEVGYFTKHGDGGVDILPIGGLVKSQVRALAGHLGVPARIIEKPPSAGLWPGQTDEGEMGLTYHEIDEYLLTGRGDEAVVARIRRMHERSEHKRSRPPVAVVHPD
jgi:NAD+ synthase